MESLADQAARFRADAATTVPGRLAVLIDARVRSLLGVEDVSTLPADLTEAERVAVDIAEQFVVDVHGISDEQFCRLGEHFSPAEQVAIMFHLACVDGFGKLERVNEALAVTA